MPDIACPRCATRVAVVPGEQPVCSGCGTRFKVSGAANIAQAIPIPPPTPPLPLPILVPTQTTPAAATRNGPASADRNPERTSVVARVAWGVFICFVGFCVVDYIAKQQSHRDITAIQQAAIGVDSCLWVIAGYVVCRAIDSITRN